MCFLQNTKGLIKKYPTHQNIILNSSISLFRRFHQNPCLDLQVCNCFSLSEHNVFVVVVVVFFFFRYMFSKSNDFPLACRFENFQRQNKRLYVFGYWQ